MDLYKLDKPDLSKINIAKLVELYTKNGDKYSKKVYEVSEPVYFYWDTIKYKTPPEGINNVEYWGLVKQIRKISSRKTFIKSESGEYFNWLRLFSTDENLHLIDIKLGGEIFTHYSHIITSYGKQRMLTKSIIEEAIASSQLEGAATTTPIAKKMLLENRPPRDKSERMIVNNYKTMQALNEKYKDQKMSHELLFELHRIITKDTLETDKQGRYRKDSDEICVNDGIKYIYFTPPKEIFINQEMKRLIKYANDEDDEGFIHPIIKAIFLHFWVGYLHPFYDGNGRIARTLFYWYLLRKGYWTIQYIPISLVIKKAHTQYGMAFIYSEQDDFDLTYFYDFHMRKLLSAMKNFTDYIHRKTEENQLVENALGNKYALNDRQNELLRYLLVKNGDQYFTPSSYMELNKISKMTAIKDLQELTKLNLIYKKKFGRYSRYFATDFLRQQTIFANKNI